MGFVSTSEALRREVARRIEAGELTGTELARRAGFTQAHISNFLNRKRGLKPAAMDRVLKAMGVTIYDLLDPTEVARRAAAREIAEPIGEIDAAAIEVQIPVVGADAAATAVILESDVRGRAKYAGLFLERLREDCPPARRAWTRFIAIEASAADAAAMWPRLTAGAELLIDRHWTALDAYRKGRRNLYAVRKQAAILVRYVERAGDRLVLRPHNPESDAEIFPLPAFAEGWTPKDFIVGRVAHIGSEI
ncbi:MAG: helix-turn-helix domain-containing protein [Candidatus Acidiferrales bacterium]